MRKQYGKISDDALSRRYRRKLSIRSKLEGTSERPRVCATRSNKHLRVQVIDDAASKTIASYQTFGKEKVDAKPTKEGARALGLKVGEGLKNQKIDKVVFDRAGYKYTGVIASLVDGIREAGILV